MVSKESIQNTILNLKTLIIALELQGNLKLNPLIKNAKGHQRKMSMCLKIIKLSEIKPSSIKPDFVLIDNLLESAREFVDSIVHEA